MRRLLLLAVVLGGPVTDLTATEPQDLTYLTEDYPPSNYLDQGQLKGVAVDVLKLIWKQLGVPESPIDIQPWARSYRQIQEMPNTVLFAMTRNTDREKLFQWVGPIYRGQHLIYGRQDSPGVASLADLKKFSVGVLREDVGASILAAAGVPEATLVSVSKVDQLVQMLMAKRLDFICLYSDSLRTYANEAHLDLSQVKPRLVAQESVLYYAFNKLTDSALVQRFQKALTAVDPQRRALVKAAGLVP